MAWCHGAPGIGLSRLRALELLADDRYRPAAEAAVRATLQVMSDREVNDRLVQLLSENREQVERALSRLAEGKYGECEDCGNRIPTERLRFRPEQVWWF